ncbi:general negative regulator of transcription subunit 5 [Coemansia biformis]|uniref:General negative regulator of transcription subunit n=1 Tax=Coemansia biformis TaxID=1286918 RepID=A0A9W7YE44_9FUNG|nr:general negative regulator of transcription subunit 5 [Coemansia biformis]
MSRKLQSEIERVFKKVAEGIEDFEECHDKVLNASNTSQKEKYESDLKKEIKKLQRLRDQIKTWIQNSEIKDKQDLLHHRKLIEKQMEKFKAIEKEMKTKAYSKEGLLQSTKLDPKEKEKLDLCNWLVDSVDTLSTQIDVLEATAETLEGSMGKKRRDPSKVERLTGLNERAERHKYHIRCLERIQRLLENESLTTEQVQRIQEDVNYYVEQNDDDEFVEDEFIYDDLPLDDEALFAIPGEDDLFHNDAQSESEIESGSESESESPTPKSAQIPHAEPELSATGRTVLGSKGGASGKHAAGSAAATPRAAGASAAAVTTTTMVAATTTTTTAGVSSSLPITIVPQPSALPPAPVESKNAWTDVKESVLSPSRPATTTGTAQPAPSLVQPWAAVASHGTPMPNGNRAALKQPSTKTLPAHGKDAGAASVADDARPLALAAAAAPAKEPVAKEPAAASGKRDGAPPASHAAAAAMAALPPPGAAAGVPQRASKSPVGAKHGAGKEQARAPMARPKCFSLFQDDDVPDAFADLMATFMKAKQQFSERRASMSSAQSRMVDLSMSGIPSLLDQERLKTRGRRAQVVTPSYYPQTALPVIEYPGMPSRLDLDTLFFAFYYQPDTYQQYLAARELSRQSWRFHKKYLTWFQRYEEPSDITDDYEQGTYIYFDYEGAWCQRKKSEFRFEYQHLEDTNL